MQRSKQARFRACLDPNLRRKPVLAGIFFTIAACLCWSLVFVAPSFVENFHPVEISLGRFLVYGLLSFSIVLIRKRHFFSRTYLPLWRKSILFAFASSILCYTGTIMNMRYSGYTTATLLFAMSPICIAIAGNLHKKECSFRKLYLSLTIMAVGIFLAKFKGGGDGPEGSSALFYLMGLFFGLIGLLSWTGFAVLNSDFLKRNQQISPTDWGLILGTSTLFQVLLIAPPIFYFSGNLAKYPFFGLEIQTFLGVCLLLGSISTYLALFFWNLGAKKIPISLSGQLMVFEILFALALIYWAEHRPPSLLELGGIGLMLAGIMIGFKGLKPAPSALVE